MPTPKRGTAKPFVPSNPVVTPGGDPELVPPDAHEPPLPPFVEHSWKVDPTAEQVALQQEIAQAEREEEEVPLTPEEEGLFVSLLSLGKRQKTLDILGHSAVIQTLSNADDIRVGMACKDYQGVELASQRGYQVAVVAAGCVSLDGIALYSPLSPTESEDSIFEKKKEKVSKMYPIVTTKLYREIMDLDTEFSSLAEKLGKSSG